MTESSAKSKSVPQTRIGRSAILGGTAARIAGNVAVGGMAQLARGSRPEMRTLLLTPSNLTKLTDGLARMRGAAMKMGQLLSMDAGDILPEELTDILARLRADADFMPPKQLSNQLDAEWGAGWRGKFARFNPRPIAAASIGQVHRAQTKDGRDVAIKVQYPGIRESIESDVKNVGSLLRVSGLLPTGLDLDALLAKATVQLKEEADYTVEAGKLIRYREQLAGEAGFTVPAYHADLSSDRVLAMDFIDSRPLEDAGDLPQDTRDQIMARLLDLTLREIFDWGFIQSDPNFANYRYVAGTDQVALLDFGAATDLSPDLRKNYRVLIRAGLDGDLDTMRARAEALGLWAPDAPNAEKEALLSMTDEVFAYLRDPGVFDFADSGPAEKLRDQGLELAGEMSTMHIPDLQVLLVQRKLAGMYLLARKMRSRLPLREMIEARL